MDQNIFGLLIYGVIIGISAIIIKIIHHYFYVDDDIDVETKLELLKQLSAKKTQPKYCTYCGTKIPKHKNYCPYCGTGLNSELE